MKLEGDDCRIEIVPERGAIVTRWNVGGREVLYLDEATLADRAKNVRGGIPILFPSPGKLEAGRYTMKQHGFARDEAFEIVSQATSRVDLELRSNERTRAPFPFEFALVISYEIRNRDLEMRIRVKNTGDVPLPFGFGIHPYFLVRDKTHARISTRATRAFDNVTKTVVPFTGFDLAQKEVDLHLFDHGSSASTLEADGHRVAITCSEEFQRWVVWTLEGKDFVCVEPWTSPANALHTRASLLDIAPESTRELAITMRA